MNFMLFSFHIMDCHDIKLLLDDRFTYNLLFFYKCIILNDIADVIMTKKTSLSFTIKKLVHSETAYC